MTKKVTVLQMRQSFTRYLCLTVLLLGGLSSADAQTISYQVKVQFAEPTTNDDGSPLLDLNEYQLQLRNADGAVDEQTLKAVSAAPAKDSTVQLEWPALVLNQGATYTVRVRACDLADVQGVVRCSTWAKDDFRVPTLAETDVPGAPVILKITGTIVIEIGQ